MTQNNRMQNPINYHSINDIRLRKAQLLVDINKEKTLIDKSINNLLYRRDNNKKYKKKGIYTILKRSVNIADGVILGWKLYNKFFADKKEYNKRNKKSFWNIFKQY